MPHVAAARNFSVILRHDMFRDPGSTVIYPDSLSGYPGTNLQDDKDFIPWKPSSTSDKYYTVDLGDGTGGTPGPNNPNYVAILGHNMGTKGVSLVFQGGPDGVVWDITRGPVSFASDRDYLNSFLPGIGASRRWWRLVFSNISDTDLEISEILFGNVVQFPQGPEPGFDPEIEVPVRFTDPAQRGGFFIYEDPYRNIQRTVDFRYRGLSATFLNNNADPSGFRYWWEAWGAKGFPSVFVWNAGPPNRFSRQAIWGPLVDWAGEPFFGLAKDGTADIGFTVVGRARRKTWTAS